MTKARKQSSGATRKLSVKLPPNDLRRLDRWIALRDTDLSREEAARELLSIALTVLENDKSLTARKNPLSNELTALRVHHLFSPEEFPRLRSEDQGRVYRAR